jgi:hypothetical protein
VRSEVTYLSQGRRQTGALTTAYADVLDRPQVQVPSARLVRVDRQFSVVGEATNIDVDPAYLTVSASLIGHDGETLTTYTNAEASMHTALPGETVPFRVDFEGVAGLVKRSEVEFSPNARVPLPVVAEDVAAVEISVLALVASAGLGRAVGVDRAQLIGDDAIDFVLRNDSVEESTVPHVFLTLRLPGGEVGWVQHAFVPEGIRPQRLLSYSMSVIDAADVVDVEVPVRVFTNSLTADTSTAPRAFLAPTAGWAGVDVSVASFTRTPG